MLLVQDTVVWLRHIADDALRARCERLPPGSRIVLDVDGTPIELEKMADGSDGRPTQGLKPVGPSVEAWRRFWPARRGEAVAVREARGEPPGFGEAVAAHEPPIRPTVPGISDAAWIARELAEIPYSDQDSVALLDAARARAPT